MHEVSISISSFNLRIQNVKKAIHWIPVYSFGSMGHVAELYWLESRSQWVWEGEDFWNIPKTYSKIRVAWYRVGQKCIISKIANLWCPLVALLGEIKTYANWVLCWRFNFIQSLFEPIFNTIYNFGKPSALKRNYFLLDYVVEEW